MKEIKKLLKNVFYTNYDTLAPKFNKLKAVCFDLNIVVICACEICP